MPSTSLSCIVIAHSSLQRDDPGNYQEATEGLERRNVRHIPLKCNYQCVRLSTIRKVATCTGTDTRSVRNELIGKCVGREAPAGKAESHDSHCWVADLAWA